MKFNIKFGGRRDGAKKNYHKYTNKFYYFPRLCGSAVKNYMSTTTSMILRLSALSHLKRT